MLFLFCNLLVRSYCNSKRICLALVMRLDLLSYSSNSWLRDGCSNCLRVISMIDFPERYSPSYICPFAKRIVFSQASRVVQAFSRLYGDEAIVIIINKYIYPHLLINSAIVDPHHIHTHQHMISKENDRFDFGCKWLNCAYKIQLFLLISLHMNKAFELTLKKGIIPVFSLPHISQGILAKVQTCKKFRDYVEKFDSLEAGTSVLKIEILGVEMFGERVGFVNMRAITQKDGHRPPAYIFLRGHAVAILMFVNQKLLLVEQYRVPVQSTLLQAPAGMIDESGDFVGVAAAEIHEETSIKIIKQDLKPLGSYFPSPGGCDEEIFMYYCHINVSEEELKAIEEKIHGKEGESQKIRVRLVDYDSDFITKTKDSKLVYLCYAYENMLKQQKKSNL